MSIIRQRGTNPGLLSRWLKHRSPRRMTDYPCAHCGRLPQVGDYIWRQVGTGHFCELCAVEHLFVTPRRVPVDQQAPVIFSEGKDV